ncbi:helix-turn-helix domain-containing protein [Anthocerotibacter panamensis]|uniref:helix-turn-helix domain-containing protein n=1 Tax=Anthocerotibacter panamensis TaxID=2857077 RepID=UPI001C405713|nr:RodZ domain-containing protein [Anthocerotibacter panamensis]
MSKPTPEQLEALGLLFVQARTSRNLSLETLSEQLRIPKHYLIAIEQAQGDRLPEPVYVRGFIRKYAQALGLESDLTILQFLKINAEATPSPKKSAPPSKRQVAPWVLWLGYGATVCVVVVALSAGLNTYFPQATVSPPALTQPAETSGPAVKPEAVAATQEVAQRSNPPGSPTTSIAALPQPEVSSPVADSTQPLNLAVSLTADSWAMVEVDGKTEFKGTLVKGDSRQWQAQKKLKVRMGNPGGVVLTYNNQLLGPAGKSGVPVTKIFEK